MKDISIIDGGDKLFCLQAIRYIIYTLILYRSKYMYIKKIYISNFRKFDEAGTAIEFNNGINVFMGENNAGKSALIDAIRLSLSSGHYRKKIYVTPDDFHINKYGERASNIKIDLYFEELTEEQGIAFYLMTDGSDTSKAEIHLSYSLQKDSKGNDKVKDYISGGPRNAVIASEVFDNINLLFLAALRDAESDLKPSRSSQLANILYSVANTDAERTRVMQALVAANETLKEDPSIKLMKSIINGNLNLIEKEEIQQNININILPPTFEAIAASLDVWYQVDHLFMKMEEKFFCEILKEFGLQNDQLDSIVKTISDGIVEIDLSKIQKDKALEKLYLYLINIRAVSAVSLKQNGLGYNNILSMAASLGDLQKKPTEEELSILLVEEPEAHLHPQLLDLLFNFFKQANNENKIQIIMTSHSPTLVSKADIDSLHLLYQYYKNKESIKSISLSNTNLSLEEKEDLKRYLDVTKSQLFFAKRIIFVEGISEGILLNEFAKLIGKPLDKYSVEIVNVNGVAFDCFAKLFIQQQDKSHLTIPCAIISDNDKCTNTDDPFQIDKKELTYSKANIKLLKEKIEKGKPSYRANKLLEFDGDSIKVKLAEKTLEYELALDASNNILLLDILETIHPEITKDIKGKIENGEKQDNIAIMIWLAIRDCKGVFAQRLARRIAKISSDEETNITFTVPSYIQEAINHVLE